MTIAPQGNQYVFRGIDKVLSVQRPVVLAHIRAIRHSKPNATPAEVIRILEHRYLAAVTTGGAMVGASAVIPAVGVGISLALSSVETAGFLEASALFAQSVTEVHGIVVEDPDRARALVMTMMLGSGGSDLVRQLAGQVTGGGPSRSGFWGDIVTKSVPSAAMGHIADQIKKTFMKKFVVQQGTNMIGRAIPFGIGAVIGGSGNHVLGRRVVKSSREAFGVAPDHFPLTLEPKVRIEKVPKPAKAPKKSGSAESTDGPAKRFRHLPPLPSFPQLSPRNRKALMSSPPPQEDTPPAPPQ